jgi:hypothetical protein
MYRAIALLLLTLPAYAHEMTPAHLKWQVSHVEGVMKAELKMFNKRRDVEFYEIGVFDKDWQPVPFVSRYKVMRMPYLSHVEFDVYVSAMDSVVAEYVCSVSKLRENSDKKTMIASRICSRFKP